jgi:hypothetical protein
MDNKLKPAEAQQIPPWLRHFFIHVIKRCAVILVAWIDDVKEMSKEAAQIEGASSNGRR